MKKFDIWLTDNDGEGMQLTGFAAIVARWYYRKYF